jgi:DNA topoisomerase IA
MSQHYPITKTRQEHKKVKEIYKHKSLMNIYALILRSILANQIKQETKGIIKYNQGSLISVVPG